MSPAAAAVVAAVAPAAAAAAAAAVAAAAVVGALIGCPYHAMMRVVYFTVMALQTNIIEYSTQA